MGITLVTGAAGFIGSNVARHFCGAGRRVVGCDRMRAGLKWRNLVDVALHDLITPEALPDWLARNATSIELVVHLGAVSATTETDVDRIARENIRQSIDLWEWCTEAAVPFLYASSAATYGDGVHGFADDESPQALARLRPLNAYGWSKQIVDRRVIADVTERRPTPPRWAGLKFFNVYGPGEDHKGEMRSLINKIIPVARSGGTVKLFRSHRPDYVDGGQMRDFVYVGDVVSVMTWLATSQARSGLYNVGSGEARTWNDLVAAVFAGFGRSPSIEYVDIPVHIRDQYQYFTRAPVDKLREAGWNGHTTSLEDGVARYLAEAER